MAFADELRARFAERLLPLQERFLALQPRERMVIAAGVILVLLTALYTLGLAPLHKAVTERQQRIVRKQEDLAWMQGIAGQLSALSAALPQANSSGESLVVVIANSASSGKLGSTLTGQTPDGANGVRVRFEGVQFDALILWLGALQKDYGIRVKAAEVNRSQQSGLVNASLTLTRG